MSPDSVPRIEHISASNGPRLAVQVTGDHPSVLLLPGSSSTSAVWLPVLAALADIGVEAAAMDLRGHGQSGGRDKLHSWRIEDYVNDVLAALRRWESIRILVGHSMGGLVAQLVAGEAALDRLVLVAPSPTEGMLRNGIRMAIAHPWTFAAAYLQRSFKRLYANRRVARALLFHPNGREEIVDRHLATVEEESWLAGNEMTSLLPDPSRVKCAVTVIAGERDFMVDRRATERTARDYGTVLRVFAGCGHMVPIEADAAELARAIVGPAAGLS